MVNLKKYQITIPSYKRPETLKKRTLKILKENKINPNKIHIFVSDNKQKNEYENSIPREDYNKIIVGKPGIKNIRNFMPKYFKEGQHIFYIDDDIYNLSKLQ